MQRVVFISGLPRTGSTLLCNILNQNPRFHATPTSGVVHLMLKIRNEWQDMVDLNASDTTVSKRSILRSILPTFYQHRPQELIFDKNRAWPAYIEMAESALQCKVKILVPVRSYVDILASFEKLWRNQSSESFFPNEQRDHAAWQTIMGRADTLMNGSNIIGMASNRMHDAVIRGFSDRMSFIEYENLTKDPKTTMAIIYRFINEPIFNHDFDNVIQTTEEDDSIHHIKDLHTIRSKVEYKNSDAYDILGDEVYNKFHGQEFWRKDNLIER